MSIVCQISPPLPDVTLRFSALSQWHSAAKNTHMDCRDVTWNCYCMPLNNVNTSTLDGALCLGETHSGLYNTYLSTHP